MNAFLRATYCCLSTVILFSACAKSMSDDNSMQMDDVRKTMEEQELKIEQYMKSHNITLTHDPKGIYYKIETPGDTSAFMNLNTIPTMSYTRSNLADSVLDASFGATNFDGRPLKDHIVGWQIGLQKIGKGGRIFMIIPSPLGFGNVSIGNIIPANTVLVCDVTLVDFK
jgi:FKBP-type peptidyl-prolyl cis-trans isomerase